MSDKAYEYFLNEVKEELELATGVEVNSEIENYISDCYDDDLEVNEAVEEIIVEFGLSYLDEYDVPTIDEDE